jgi:hypothetical protein
VEALIADGLRIDARHDVPRGTITLAWRGTSTGEDSRGLLGRYLDAVIAVAKPIQARIELRFEHMDYANSSTLSVIFDFTQSALAAGLRLLYVFDASQRWQRVSLDAIRVFDTGDGNLELRSSAVGA